MGAFLALGEFNNDTHSSRSFFLYGKGDHIVRFVSRTRLPPQTTLITSHSVRIADQSHLGRAMGIADWCHP